MLVCECPEDASIAEGARNHDALGLRDCHSELSPHAAALVFGLWCENQEDVRIFDPRAIQERVAYELLAGWRGGLMRLDVIRPIVCNLATEETKQRHRRARAFEVFHRRSDIHPR